MTKLPRIRREDVYLSIVALLILGLPIAIALTLKGFGYLPSAVVGLLVSIYAGLAILSEEYIILRIVNALIGTTLSILICHYMELSITITVLVAIFGTILGYFSRKWMDIISYVS